MAPHTDNQFWYLPIDQHNVDWDLYVTSLGATTIHAGQPYPPQGHPPLYDFNWSSGRVLPEYQLVHVAFGKGIFQSAASGKRPVSAGDVILLFPGQWHRYRPDSSTGWSERWISMNGEYLHRLVQRGLMSPEEPILHPHDSGRLEEIHRMLMGLVHSHNGENSNEFAAYAMQSLALVLEGSRRTGSRFGKGWEKVDDALLSFALQRIWSHSHRNTVVDDLVAALPVTRRTLERRFAVVLGRSIGQEIARCRIERAKHLLRQTRLPLEQIALAAGFSDATRMGKVFRRIENMSPSEFRQKNRNDGTNT